MLGGYSTLDVVLLTACLLCGVGQDLLTRRVANGFSAAIAVGGLWARGATFGVWPAAQGFFAGTLVLALLWLPWRRGIIGGGDVKLAAACGIWVGLSNVAALLLLSALLGGVVAAATYISSGLRARYHIRQNLKETLWFRALPKVARNDEGGRLSVPYAVAIAGGTLMVLLMERAA